MKMRHLILPLAMLVCLASCRTSKDDIAYISDAPRDTAMVLHGEFSKGIQANDLLNIYVESVEPSSTIQFNQETNKIAVSSSGTVMNPGSAAGNVSGYLVDKEGYITFPVLGRIKVAGYTHLNLAKEIEKRLVDDGHIKDPRVTVKLMNFKVSVLGEVAKPGELIIPGERITILEALAMVGDLTIHGQRTNITIIREENGERTIGNLDLTSKNIFESPYYYLHQNDVVYVEPNIRKKKSASRDMTWMSYLSSAVSVVSLAFTSLYYLTLTRKYNQ